jgi:hypothetical protein
MTGHEIIDGAGVSVDDSPTWAVNFNVYTDIRAGFRYDNAILVVREHYPAMTNDVAFSATNGQFWASYSSVTQAVSGDIERYQWITPPGYWSNLVVTHPTPTSISEPVPAETNHFYDIDHFSAPAFGWATGSTRFRVSDSEWATLKASFEEFAEIVLTNHTPDVAPAHQHAITPERFFVYYSAPTTYEKEWYEDFPAMKANLKDVTATYRYQFQSLTNYLNHAPAR